VARLMRAALFRQAGELPKRRKRYGVERYSSDTVLVFHRPGNIDNGRSALQV